MVESKGSSLRFETAEKQQAALGVVNEVEIADLYGAPVDPLIRNAAEDLRPLLRRKGIDPFPHVANAANE